MNNKVIPKTVLNWVDGKACGSKMKETFPKLSPIDGRHLCDVARSREADVSEAVQAAKNAQTAWAELTPVERGDLLFRITNAMEKKKEEIAQIVHIETGMSFASALAETGGAISLGMFMAGEGRRLYGRTTTSAVPHKYAMTVRQPLGVAGLIIAANTPIANVAWKAFPALVCGNTAIMKAAEDAPATSDIFARIAHEEGLPPGVFNLIHGYGKEAGVPLVEHQGVDLISFTGSTAVGTMIAEIAGKRLAKVSLELGGKNPLIVCDDADLDNAAKWVLLSAFSNAGQRCASASRIIIFSSIYEQFRDLLVMKTKELSVGAEDTDFYGPVINQRQLDKMLSFVNAAQLEGAKILIGGKRMTDAAHLNGFYMEPTLIENVHPKAEISRTELFGPVACLYSADDFQDALALANDSPYGLTACIHTSNFNRAWEFTQKVRTGVAVVNAGTYGSEPHMPFGGLKQSGNGSKEPGTEALDVYSELKVIYLNVDPVGL